MDLAIAEKAVRVFISNQPHSRRSQSDIDGTVFASHRRSHLRFRKRMDGL